MPRLQTSIPLGISVVNCSHRPRKGGVGLSLPQSGFPRIRFMIRMNLNHTVSSNRDTASDRCSQAITGFWARETYLFGFSGAMLPPRSSFIRAV